MYLETLVFKMAEKPDVIYKIEWNGLELWCLTPLSTVIQLYRGGRFY